MEKTRLRWCLSLVILSMSLCCFSKERECKFTKISSSPEIYECDHFLTESECNKIIEEAKPLLMRSTVVDANSSSGLVDSRRTSLGMFLPRINESSVIQSVRSRMKHITGLSEQNGENIQVLYYTVGGEYRPHYDYFDPSTPGGHIHYHRGGQRIATLLMYLNTVEAGGETVFPQARLAITPTKGKAVLFYNVDPNGREDPKSLHGGAPVIAGEKWIATLWLRAGAFQ